MCTWVLFHLLSTNILTFKYQLCAGAAMSIHPPKPYPRRRCAKQRPRNPIMELCDAAVRRPITDVDKRVDEMWATASKKDKQACLCSCFSPEPMQDFQSAASLNTQVPNTRHLCRGTSNPTRHTCIGIQTGDNW